MRPNLKLEEERFRTMYVNDLIRSCQECQGLLADRCRRSGFLGIRLKVFSLHGRFIKGSRVMFGIRSNGNRFELIFILCVTNIIIIFTYITYSYT